MKKIILATLAMASVSAFAGERYRVEIDCNRGESGQQCEKIVSHIREGKMVGEATQGSCTGEREFCATAGEVGVPKWLQGGQGTPYPYNPSPEAGYPRP